MRTPQIRRVPFESGTLQVLAGDLLSASPAAAAGDLSSALVLLPSARACRTLGHILLELSGRSTLLLPRIQTVTQWSGEAAVACGLDPERGPDDRFRHLWLSPRLAATSWLADRPESAPGLARELIRFFDEVRLHGRADLLLDPSRLDELQVMAGAAEADILAADLDRVHEAWRLYRDLVPFDRTDHLIELAALLPGVLPPNPSRPALVAVAGFSRMDPTRASLLNAAFAAGAEARLYLPEASGLLSRLLLCTWGERPGPTDPLAAARQVERLLTGSAPEPVPVAGTTLRERLASLGSAGSPAALLAPDGPLEFRPCGSTEQESRVIADRVVNALGTADQAGLPAPRITIATSDPRLAARVRAQLWDAGIDTDDTHGEPLSALPAGLLLRFILRAALTDMRIGPLLEVLTHPYVCLPVGATAHYQWTLRLEQMYRRDRGPRGGLGALHRRADERDEAVLNLFRGETGEPGAGMVDFVTLLADAFAPLQPLGDGRPHPWPQLLAAVRRCWQLLASEHELADQGAARADIGRLHKLLADLERDAALLPPVTLAGFSSELTRLLADETAAGHRKPHWPVVIAGLVEARLERCDLLILAGLRDGVFPARSKRPLFLSGALRERLGLPGWSQGLARDAELFARLLHGAPQVLLTWSTEEDGAPCLPSSFVSRLELVLGSPTPAEATPPLWRTAQIPWLQIKAAEQEFSGADPAVRTAVATRPLTRLSWSALRTWRDCPYRFLLERGFALRREEEVQEEFSRMDYGNLVHAALQDWLAPEGPGYSALAAGDAGAAAAALDRVALEHFARGSDDLPQRQLWGESFRLVAPALARYEVGRFRNWRPVALECGFTLPLADLHAWTVALCTELGTGDAPADLPVHAVPVVLRGTIDRVDGSRHEAGAWAVLDYKTGSVPSGKQVTELEDLQVLLYAAAVEIGAAALPGPPGPVREGFYYAVQAEKAGGPAKPHLVGDEDGRLLLAEGCSRLVQLAVAASDPNGAFGLLPRELDGTGPTRLPCTFCDFRGTCRIEERELPAGTERKLDKLVNRKDNA